MTQQVTAKESLTVRVTPNLMKSCQDESKVTSKLRTFSTWTQVTKLRFQLWSLLYLEFRLYKLASHVKRNGFQYKVVGAALLDVSGNNMLLRDQTAIQQFMLPPIGGVLVAQLSIDRGDKTFGKNCNAQFRVQTLYLSDKQAEAKLSDTYVRLTVVSQTAMDNSSKGITVKCDRNGASALKFDTSWNWPIRISVHDARTGIELGSCLKQLHELLSVEKDQTTKLSITDCHQRQVGEVEVQNIASLPLATEQAFSDTAVFRNVCVAVDYSCTNVHSKLNSQVFTVDKRAHISEALLKVVTLFDPEQTYTPWGFGAQIEGKVRTIFQCGPEKTVSGSQDLIRAYESFQSTIPHSSACSNISCTNEGLDIIIQAASRTGRVLVILLSDFEAIDWYKLKRTCEQKPNLFVILIMMMMCSQKNMHANAPPIPPSSTTLCNNVVVLTIDSL